MSSRRAATPSWAISAPASATDSLPVSRSGITSASTRSAPSARAHSVVTTELSTPPESPTTAPLRRSVPSTWARMAATISATAAAASSFSTSAVNT